MTSLKSNDLKGFVNEIFTIDSYKSKMGKDENVAVLAFEVSDQEPAKDLMSFIEKGYPFILDADVSSGENRKGKYDVFVEMERNRYIGKNIKTILDDVQKLAGVEDWKYRYYKEIESKPFTEELDRFFNKGVTEQKYISDNMLEFKRHASGSVRLEIIDEGTTEEITGKYVGASKLDEVSMSEVLWLTKFFGNYNIYKVEENLFFTNGVRTKVLQRKK